MPPRIEGGADAVNVPRCQGGRIRGTVGVSASRAERGEVLLRGFAAEDARSMKLTVLTVGKLRDAWVKAGCDEYEKRVRTKIPFEAIELKSSSDIARRLPARHEVWALDERGVQLSSAELAEKLRGKMNEGIPGVVFLVGGADGLPRELVDRAQLRWSLGRLTLPHRLARLILVEQLYRALSIMRGEPYHRE
jgi:23S rRNA (pseudouridine1915-N3)-methyltransferase